MGVKDMRHLNDCGCLLEPSQVLHVKEGGDGHLGGCAWGCWRGVGGVLEGSNEVTHVREG